MLKVLKKDDENKGLWQSYVSSLKLCKDIIAFYKWYRLKNKIGDFIEQTQSFHPTKYPISSCKIKQKEKSKEMLYKLRCYDE